MKYARFLRDGVARTGIVHEGKVYDIAEMAARNVLVPPGLETLEQVVKADLGDEFWFEQVKRASGAGLDLTSVALLAPIERPGKILCLALNYAAHVAETRHTAPSRPYTFLKPATSICGPDDAVRYPETCQKLSFEAELAVVIGKRGRAIPAEKAYDHVFGYTIMNDMSARDLSRTNLPTIAVDWYLGKGFDTSAPTGPWVVSRTEVPDPQDLDICLTVNGEVRQQGNTSQMLFPIPILIEALSRNVTLEPGDLIATGTPAGAAGEVLVGDKMEITIESIGQLRNTIVQA